MNGTVPLSHTALLQETCLGGFGSQVAAYISQLSWTEVLFHIYLAAGVIGRLHPPWFWAVLGGGSRFSLVPSPNLQHICAAGRIWGHIQWRAQRFSQRSIPPLPSLQPAPQHKGIEILFRGGVEWVSKTWQYSAYYRGPNYLEQTGTICTPVYFENNRAIS